MPRRRSPPRLYLDPARRQWVIRDGQRLVRTGCAEPDRHGAEARLAAYLGQKHTPQRGPSPVIADVLLAYASEHLPQTRAAKNAAYNVGNLSVWWGDKKLSDVTAKNCRSYAANKSPAAARRDLEVLRAAIGYWHREYGPLPSIPAVVLPPKPAPRERWLTRSEAARLLRAARHTPHLARFILLGIYTGTRSGALLAAQWSWPPRSGYCGEHAEAHTAGQARSANSRAPTALAQAGRWHQWLRCALRRQANSEDAAVVADCNKGCGTRR